MKPKVAIIILNWNGLADTEAVLKNLEDVTYKNFTAMVVDNHSTDNSVKKLQAYSKTHPKTTLLALDQNYGYSEGNNKGYEHLKSQGYEYILLLNNDTVLAPDFLNQLVEAAEQNPKLGALAPLIYFASPNGKKSQDIWFSGGWLNFFAGGGHHQVNQPPSQQPQPSQFLTGCCLLVRTEAIQKIEPLFDPAFFAYDEDVDLSLRLSQKGYDLAVVPNSTI